MMKKILLFFIVLISINAFAQTPNTEYGVFSKEELSMTHCKFDSLAEAVILCEWGKYYFDNDFTLDFHHYKRIKILKESGLHYADQTFEYNSSYQKIENVFATVTTIDSDGKLIKTEVDKSLIHYSNVINYLSKVTISFPNVKVGSIIEFHYTISFTGFSMPDWLFQEVIPTVFSKITIECPEIFRYVSIGTGCEIDKDLLKKDESQSISAFPLCKYNHTKSYTLTNIPAIKSEPKCRSLYEDLEKIQFFPRNIPLARASWKDEVFILLNDDPAFYHQLSSTPSTSKLLTHSGLNSSQKSKYEKMIGIQKLVRETMHWNGNYSTFTSNEPEEVFRKKEGNSADINFIFGA
jgi:hypothetical protein